MDFSDHGWSECPTESFNHNGPVKGSDVILKIKLNMYVVVETKLVSSLLDEVALHSIDKYPQVQPTSRVCCQVPGRVV